MSRQSIMWLVLGPLSALGLACQATTGAAVSTSGTVVGSTAPDITYVGPDGKQRSLDKSRFPVTVLAFASPPADQCCWFHPKLLFLASEYTGLPITVVQVSEPTDRCPRGPGCVQNCRVGNSQLATLCDSGRVVWNAFNRPAPGSVYLIDVDNHIVDQATMDDLDALSYRAMEMAQTIRDWETWPQMGLE